MTECHVVQLSGKISGNIPIGSRFFLGLGLWAYRLSSITGDDFFFLNVVGVPKFHKKFHVKDG